MKTYNNGEFTIQSDCIENYTVMVDIINQYGLTGEQVLEHLTNWHGCQLLDEDFMGNLLSVELDMFEDDEEVEEDDTY